MARAAEDKGEAMRLLDDWLNAMHRLGKTAQRDRLLQEVRKLHANERAPLPPLSEQPMTGERFWALLEAASSGAADMAGFLDALEQGLLACTGEALVAFQKLRIRPRTSGRYRSSIASARPASSSSILTHRIRSKLLTI